MAEYHRNRWPTIGRNKHTPENADAIRAVASSLYGYVVLSAIEQVLA